MLKVIFGGVLAQISGNAIWVLSLINLAWMLFRGYQLFSWWYVIYAFITFVVSLIIVLFGVIASQD